MMSQTQAETFSDALLAFTIPSREARGRFMRFDRVLDEILSSHDYPAPVRHLLSEALVLTALIGSLVKDDSSQVTMQAQTKKGAVSLLVCDYQGGALRGYADFDAERLDQLGANPSLEALFDEGFLALTFDLAGKQGRYQGVVPLEGASLSEACQLYFAQSEQVPTLLRVAVSFDGEHCLAAGLLAQHLPDGEEGRERLHARLDHPEWEHVATMAGSIRHDELLNSQLSLDALTWRLFHEEDEVLIQPSVPLSKGCRCTAEHYRAVLSRFSDEELADMRDEKGTVPVDCAFCSKQFAIEV
jgi:molecular chaperone Hsp33